MYGYVGSGGLGLKRYFTIKTIILYILIKCKLILIFNM